MRGEEEKGRGGSQCNVTSKWLRDVFVS